MTTSTSKKNIFVRTLIDHYHLGDEQELIRFWDSQNSVEEIDRIGRVHGEPKDLLIDPERALEEIHYSWIAEAMENLPKHLHPSILASFGNTLKQQLCRQYGIEVDTLDTIPDITKKFLLEKVYLQLEGVNEVFPLSFSPEYPLSKLLEMDKNLLLELFDLLGLHDLAIKAKHIVDKTTLNYIYASLTPIRKKIFNVFLQQQDKAQLPQIDLSNWSGEPRILKKILHRRGILRLSNALSGYSKDFMWHFTRRLDTGRGRIVLRYYSEETTQLVPILTEQVQFILNMITQKSE